jgi:hypothetical protein
MMTLHRYAYFITPHGYGHATRACAVMLAMKKAEPDSFFDIYTRVPKWLFDVSLGNQFAYHELMTDVGMVQDSVMDENLPTTVQRLSELLPFRPELVNQLARELKSNGCVQVLCDVAALGIAVARAAKLPSILIENFTWDWIYEGYLEQEPRLRPYINYLHDVYASANFHIRTQPDCSNHLKADMVSSVVGRRPRTPGHEIRELLAIPDGKPLILITMGGIGSEYHFLHKIEEYPDACFVVPGGNQHFERRGSLVLLAHHSDFYHPDLVEASEAVIGKLGYSTLAEAYLAGIPYAFIPRPRFPESEVMDQFVLEHMNGIELPEEQFFSGEWLNVVPKLLSLPRRRPTSPDGGEQIAEFIRSHTPAT